jgi:hypothetical protein
MNTRNETIFITDDEKVRRNYSGPNCLAPSVHVLKLVTSERLQRNLKTHCERCISGHSKGDGYWQHTM